MKKNPSFNFLQFSMQPLYPYFISVMHGEDLNGRPLEKRLHSNWKIKEIYWKNKGLIQDYYFILRIKMTRQSVNQFTKKKKTI